MRRLAVDGICGLLAVGPWCVDIAYRELFREGGPALAVVVKLGFPAVLIATPLNLWYGGWLRRRAAKRSGVVGALLWLASFAGAVGSVLALTDLGPSWVLRVWPSVYPDLAR